jgi:DNA-binding CsgD family transcriptional regulator
MAKPLTDREKEVAQLVAQGCTYIQIGSRLGVSFESAKTYVKRLRTKLDLASKDALADWARDHLPEGAPAV